jgi:aldehyde dehydrogenase (NAD+)
MDMNILEAFTTMSYGPAPEDTREALAWLDRHDRCFGLFIDGAWCRRDQLFETINPATGEAIATCAIADETDVDAAVEAARRAFPLWSSLSGHQRARHLYALARLVQKHARRLAVLETLDNGKPIRETRDIDVPLVARHFYHHAGWAQMFADVFPGQVPLGVVGQIIPWNFPLLMLAWKIAPALAAGNTVVLKPAEYTPLTAMAFAELCIESGLPAGVVNIVTGAGETGAALVAHPGIDKIAFTGSTEVGREIRRRTAGTTKRITLELGGKSPFIVFDDADLDAAVEGVVDGIWLNQGEVCCAGSRLLVHEAVASDFHARLRRRMETLRLGDPLDKSTDIGAVVAPAQLERIRRLVACAIEEGAECHQPASTVPSAGLFFPPTLLTNVGPASTAAQVEIFGPVLVSMTFRTPAEAAELANNTVYGLAASIWSETIGVALELAAKVKAGVVWVNGTNRFDAACGFGGYRESGYGREGGREGMAEYLCPAWIRDLPPLDADEVAWRTAEGTGPKRGDGIDRTAKLYIGGKQKRPDSGYSEPVAAADGSLLGEVPLGNRKDVRDAVEAARKAVSWERMDGHARAQVLYFFGENLILRRDEFADRLDRMTGSGRQGALMEVEAGIEAAFSAAAWADKYEGTVHNPPGRVVTMALHEPLGVVGIVCPDQAPFAGFLSLTLHAVGMGNRVVAVPSAAYPLIAADFYQVFDTSDVPAGVINIVSGRSRELAMVLAGHADVDGIWYFGTPAHVAEVTAETAANLKRIWTHEGRSLPWKRPNSGLVQEMLRQAVQVKNVWVPYGA